MKRKSCSIAFFVTVMLAVSACKKNYDIYQPPHSIFFLIQDEGIRLPDSVLDSAKLYYIKGNSEKHYLNDFGRAVDEGPFPARTLGLLTTREITRISSDNNVKTFYFEYKNGDLDTLYISCRHLSREQAIKDPCFCYYPHPDEVKFNGMTAPIDTTTPDGNPVYLLAK